MSFYAPNEKLPFLGALAVEFKDEFHRPPGDGLCPDSYSFPLIRETIKGATTWKVVVSVTLPDKALISYIEACKVLEDKGCIGIITSCGFLAQIQSRLADKINIPIATNSLLQIPFLFNILKPRAKIGVLTFDPTVLGTPHFIGVGITGEQIERLVIVGSGPEKQLFEMIVGGGGPYIHDQFEEELVSLAKNLVSQHPDIGALVLECTQMPPFAKAIQRATGLPVYDITTLADWFYSGIYRGIFVEDKNKEDGLRKREKVIRD